MSLCLGILDTPLPGLKLIQRTPVTDSRGYFERLFCKEELQQFHTGKDIVQINHTLTAKCGVVRGLHFQYPPHAETKIVSCLRGEVFDVAVDLRRGSSTLLMWHGEVLSADNHRTFLIPEGFAHGFQTLTDDCELIYLHTAAYRPSSEGGLNALDPRINIRWPKSIVELSPKDASLPVAIASFDGVVV